MASKIQLTPLHITVVGILILLIEIYNQGISNFFSFNSDYVFYGGLFVALIGFFLGMDGGSK